MWGEARQNQILENCQRIQNYQNYTYLGVNITNDGTLEDSIKDRNIQRTKDLAMLIIIIWNQKITKNTNILYTTLSKASLHTSNCTYIYLTARKHINHKNVTNTLKVKKKKNVPKTFKRQLNYFTNRNSSYKSCYFRANSTSWPHYAKTTARKPHISRAIDRVHSINREGSFTLRRYIDYMHRLQYGRSTQFERNLL